MKLSGLNILVTGGAGFIGSHLIDKLIQENCYVRVLDNLSTGKLENLEQHKNCKRFQFIYGDVTNYSDIKKAILDIDIAFHLSCLGVRHSIAQPYENHKVNCEGTFTVLQAALESNVKKFIYCSSSEVYGTAIAVPMSEDHPTYPSTVYGASKLAGESYARAYYKTYGLNTVIVRPFNTYGPRSHHEGRSGEIIPKTIIRALNNEPIYIFGDGTQTRDFTYVEDTVNGLVIAAQNDNLLGQTVNIGSSFDISIHQLVEMILILIGDTSSSIEFLASRPGDVFKLYADNTKFSKLTGWKPEISFSDGLKRTLEWFKLHPTGIKNLFEQEKVINWE